MSDAWSLPSRLRGKYPVGRRLPTGEPELGYRDFPPVNFDGSLATGHPAIQEEAAARIEALEAALRGARATLQWLHDEHRWNLGRSGGETLRDAISEADVALGVPVA